MNFNNWYKEHYKASINNDTSYVFRPHNYANYASKNRKHQNEALDAMKSQMIGQICLPTGTGKTRIQICEHLRTMIDANNSGTNTVQVIVAHRLALCAQILSDLQEEIVKLGFKVVYLNANSERCKESPFFEKYSSYGASEKNTNFYSSTSSEEILSIYKDTMKNQMNLIIVATYQSFDKLCELPKINLITYDEAHMIASTNNSGEFANNVKKVKGMAYVAGGNCKEFFFTATRKITKDGGGMDDASFYGDVIFERSPRIMIDAGEILQPRLHIITPVENFSDCDNTNMQLMTIVKAFTHHKNQVKYNSCNPSKIGAKLLISFNGVKNMLSIYCSEQFAKFCKENSIKSLCIASESKSNYFDFKNYRDREDALNGIRNMPESDDAILMHVDTLAEGIDIPGITGVMPFLDFGECKLVQTIGRAARLHKEDRERLYSGKLIPNDSENYIKPYCWIILPQPFVVQNEMEDRARSLYLNYEGPVEIFAVDGSFIGKKNEELDLRDEDVRGLDGRMTDVTHRFKSFYENMAIEEFFSSMDELNEPLIDNDEKTVISSYYRKYEFAISFLEHKGMYDRKDSVED